METISKIGTPLKKQQQQDMEEEEVYTPQRDTLVRLRKVERGFSAFVDHPISYSLRLRPSAILSYVGLYEVCRHFALLSSISCRALVQVCFMNEAKVAVDIFTCSCVCIISSWSADLAARACFVPPLRTFLHAGFPLQSFTASKQQQ